MALIEYDIMGNVRDKVKRSIEILQSFCPPEGYYLADSGGKDSAVARTLCKMAGVKFDAHYSVTTVDPPELVKSLIRQYPSVIYDMPDGTQRYFLVDDGRLRKVEPDEMPGFTCGNVIHFAIPKYPMRKLIVKKQFPPTRLMRYCCEDLKEIQGEGRIVVTGVRAAESMNRKKNQGMVTVFKGAGMVSKIAEENDANFTLTPRGGWC